MTESKPTFNVLASIEKHIEFLKPLLPKQAIVCVGEYPIKTYLKEPRLGILPFFVEKSSDDIYRWLPKEFESSFVLDFEEKKVDTHFWYTVLPTIKKDNSIVETVNKIPEKLKGTIIFSSVWDGIGSAALPVLIEKFRTQHVDTFSIAMLPSKIQPGDAHFNACGAIQTCLATDGATVLLIDREKMKLFEGVDRKGAPMKDTAALSYLINVFLAKPTFVEEIAELSRTFGIKLFSPLVITGASYTVYGSIENMLDAALLEPLLTADLSSASLLYVLLRMPTDLKETLPRAKLELAITEWFKDKTSLQSIHITEPIYTEENGDRIDAVLLIGNSGLATQFDGEEKRVAKLKSKAVEAGFITEDWQVILPPEPEKPIEEPKSQEAPPAPVEPQAAAETKPASEGPIDTQILTENKQETPPLEPTAPIESADSADEKEALIDIEEPIKEASLDQPTSSLETPQQPLEENIQQKQDNVEKPVENAEENHTPSAVTTNPDNSTETDSLESEPTNNKVSQEPQKDCGNCVLESFCKRHNLKGCPRNMT